MHGRPRLPKGQLPDPEKVKQQEQKAALFGKLLREVRFKNVHREQFCPQVKGAHL